MKIEDMMKKFDDFFEGQLKNFKDTPVKSTVKLLILYYVAKTVYNWMKKQ